jgi:hypothetical protein
MRKISVHLTDRRLNCSILAPLLSIASLFLLNHITMLGCCDTSVVRERYTVEPQEIRLCLEIDIDEAGSPDEAVLAEALESLTTATSGCVLGPHGRPG